MTNGLTGDPSHEPGQQPLRVALDASFLALPASGIGSYVAALLPALARRGDVRVQALHQPVTLGPRGARALRLAWDATGVGLTGALAARESDVLHIPAFSAPVFARLPMVVTIHDVIPLVLPEYRASRGMRLYVALMTRTVRRASIVLTPSLHAAGEIERVLGIPRERIRVTPLAADPSLGPAADANAVRAAVAERFGVRRPYLLHMAGFDRRKNVPLLVRAFARALPSLPNDTALVLAGASHSDNPTVFPPVEPVIVEEGVADRVVLTGRVSEEDRRLLYQGALGYVTPSSYEGFGLTPLEAMACGVPVIASNRTSLPEVVGDAGLLVEPEVDAVAAAIVTLATDDALRADLSDQGLARAGQFSWARTAELTVAAYREAIAIRSGG